MKKIICFICVITIALTFPRVAHASEVEYPTINDYRFMIDYDKSYQLQVWTDSWVERVNRPVPIGRTESFTYNVSSAYRIRDTLDITEYLLQYWPLIKTSTKVWMSYKISVTSTTTANVTSGNVLFHSVYDIGDGEVRVPTGSSQWNGVLDGSPVLVSPYDYGTVFSTTDNLSKFQIQFTRYAFTSGNVTFTEKLNSFAIIVYLQGVSGTDAEIFLVINGGFQDVESAINEVRDEVRVMQGQLDNIEDSINQGFDGVLNPDSGDQQVSNQFGSDVSDKKEESDMLLGEMDKLDKPTIDDSDINPLDKVNINDVEFVGDSFNVLFESNTLLTFSTMALVFAFLGYILYGKRG